MTWADRLRRNRDTLCMLTGSLVTLAVMGAWTLVDIEKRKKDAERGERQR